MNSLRHETEILRDEFDFARPFAPEVQGYLMVSRMYTRAPDGRVVDETVFRLRLTATPGSLLGIDGDRYTCTSFTVQHGEEAERAIPSLSGWSYLFNRRPAERDELGQVLGIDHRPFEKLVDESGKPLPQGTAYQVYNAFVDFHSFQVFTEPTPRGPGIQDLRRVGQRIVHAASHSRPPTSLRGSVADGSYFENGEVTIELKGLGLADDRPCAIIGYDSGSSSFLMLMQPAPEIEIRTVGSSHYWGDVYKDLESQWIRRADLTEIVVSETAVPNETRPRNAFIERSILVRNVDPR